jgi:hypothetical protein
MVETRPILSIGEDGAYQSIEAAVTAIDRYFGERNEHFLNHPAHVYLGEVRKL